jgi:hypothetical protein
MRGPPLTHLRLRRFGGLSRIGPQSAVHSLYAFGARDAIGFSPLAIESVANPEHHPLARRYAMLSELAPMILAAQGKGILSAQEGRIVNGRWRTIRWLNGDQTHEGRHIRLEPNSFAGGSVVSIPIAPMWAAGSQNPETHRPALLDDDGALHRRAVDRAIVLICARRGECDCMRSAAGLDAATGEARRS